jgi:hypothetical protein
MLTAKEWTAMFIVSARNMTKLADRVERVLQMCEPGHWADETVETFAARVRDTLNGVE